MTLNVYVTIINKTIQYKYNMSHLRVFTVQADVDGRLARKRDSERLSSLREGPDPQRGVRQLEPEDVSPC